MFLFKCSGRSPIIVSELVNDDHYHNSGWLCMIDIRVCTVTRLESMASCDQAGADEKSTVSFSLVQT